MENLIQNLFAYMGISAVVQTYLPAPLREWLDRKLQTLWERLFQTTDPHVHMEVEERSGGHSYNGLYREIGVYLSSLRASMDTLPRLKVFRAEEESSFSFRLPDDETLEDNFEGARVWWTHSCPAKAKEGGGGVKRRSEEGRSYTLRFLQGDRDVVLPAYLDHIAKLAGEIERRNAQRYIYTNDYGGSWESTVFNHPSSFDTLALEGNLVERIRADLDSFVKGEKFYHRNGRAWKRGYLLYGPPGTGKSSMIAAIANYLKFDIYDLELTKVSDNSELKSLLIQTERKSIIVIEDIDCSVRFADRTTAEDSSDDESEAAVKRKESTTDDSSKLTLSGLLNVTDGLWSCCGEERMFIFTTNHKDRLDPALLRPGRMDMHILLSYCSFAAIQKMACRYLDIHSDHPLLPAIRKTIEASSHQVTPAAVAELLMSNQNDPDAALKQVMAALEGSSAQKEKTDYVDDDSHPVLQVSPKKRHKRRYFFIFRFKSKGAD